MSKLVITVDWFSAYRNSKAVQNPLNLSAIIADCMILSLNCTIHRIEIQLFCYIFYSQVMGNESGLLTGSIPITIPYDAIFSNNSWSVTYCLVQGWQRAAPGPHAAPGLFHTAPGPSSKNRAGRKNHYCSLLIIHFYIIYIADYLICASETTQF